MTIMGKEIVAHKDRLSNLRGMFEKAKPGIAAVLPKHLTAEKILKIVLSAASRTPTLLECTAESILLAVMQSASLGLEPNTPLGLAYLIPYKGKDGRYECQFIPGYRGLIKLALQSGDVTTIRTRVVHKDDEFLVEYGTTERLTHRPKLGSSDDAADPSVIAVYAVAEFKGGSVQFEVMTKDQIDMIRARSRSSGSGPWATDYEEMARKTVVRRLAKYLPLSPELAATLEAQARVEAGDGPDYGDIVESVPALSGDAHRALGNGETLREKVVASAERVQGEAPQE